MPGGIATADGVAREVCQQHPADHPIQIATLIGSLSRSVELLTVDIEHEETPSSTWPAIARWRP